MGAYQCGNIDGGISSGSGSLETTTHGEELIDGVQVVLAVSIGDSLVTVSYLGSEGLESMIDVELTLNIWMWSKTWS